MLVQIIIPFLGNIAINVTFTYEYDQDFRKLNNEWPVRVIHQETLKKTGSPEAEEEKCLIGQC